MSTLKGIIFYDSQQKFPFKQKEKTGSPAGVPFWAGERQISPGDNDLRLPNSPEPIFHNNHILKSLNICF